MVSGKVENLLTNMKGVLMGFGLAKKMNAQLGDRVTITTPDGTLMNLYVVGIFQMGLTALDESLCYANIQTVQTILQKDKNYVTDIKVRLKEMDLSNELAKKFQKLYGNKVSDWKEENASLLTTFVIRNTMTIVVAITMLIVAGFGIYNIMSMTINDKMKDIAILKANGFAAKDIMAIFINQAVIIGFLGAISGLILGFTLSYIVSTIPFNGGGMMNITHFPVNFYPIHYSIGLVFGIVTTIVAAYLPSRKAGKIDPVSILRS
jgi:lipoprotein-releasing system permease protein